MCAWKAFAAACSFLHNFVPWVQPVCSCQCFPTDAFIFCVGGRCWVRGHLHKMVPSDLHNDGCPFSRLLRCGVGPPGLKNLRFAMTIQIRHPPVFDGRLGFGHPPPLSSPGDCQIKQSFHYLSFETVRYNSPKPSSCRKKGARKKKFTLNRTHDNKNAMNAPMVLVVDPRGHYNSRRHFADGVCSHIQMSRSITFSMRKQKCNPCSQTECEKVGPHSFLCTMPHSQKSSQTCLVPTIWIE